MFYATNRSHKIKIIYSHTGVKHFYTRKRGARPFPEHADDWFDLQNFSFLAFCIVGRTNDFVQIIPPFIDLVKHTIEILVEGLLGHDGVKFFKVNFTILIIICTFNHFQQFSISHGFPKFFCYTFQVTQ